MKYTRLCARLLATSALALLAGCASVPMATPEEDAASKTFAAPPAGKAGLYVFRNTWVGQAVRKTIYLDGAPLGETANEVFLHCLIAPGPHKLSTESEFSNNDVEWTADAGQNYFFRNYIKMGVFVAGANLEQVTPEVGKENVLQCKRALGVPLSPVP
jgi:hypothetical protein